MDIGDDLNLHHNDIDNVCLKSKTGYESAHEREIWYDQSYNLPAFFDGEKKVILADNAKKENNLPVAPTNPETYFLNANKEWSEIHIGNGGFAANLYFTTKDSDVTGYKKIEYTAEATETELSGTLTNQEALFRTYLFDSPIKTTIIDAGAWIGTFRVKVSGTEGVTQLKFEAFVRHVDNTETVLFSYYSTEINNTNYLTIKNESHQPSYVVHATDRLGVKIYGKTTHPAPITIYTIIGDGDASYFTTPLRIRHNQLRDLNGDEDYQHVTTVKTAAWDAKLDVSTIIPSLDTIDKRLTPAINEVNAIAKGAGNGETVTDIEALVILLNAAVPTDYPYGKNFYIIDTEVPDFWISVVSSTSVPYTYVDDTTFLDDIAVTGILQIGYYSISVLEGQKVDLTDYYDKSAADLLLGAKEDITNKSSNVDTDKTSSTKYANVKAIYDWAVGKFIDLAKLVTSWSATPTHDNIPSEKLVKDSLNLKADIDPTNGSTSALRALFTSVPEANCVYNTNTGYYEMNGVNNLTESDVLKSYHCLLSYRNQSSGSFQKSQIRTNFYLGLIGNAGYNCGAWCQNLTTLEVFKFYIHNYITITTLMFYGCSNLITAETFRMDGVTSSANCANMFNGCAKLVTAYLKGLKVSFSFEWSPLLSLASLQYLVTNRANGTDRITITVHATVWAKLNDSVNYPDWNALLVTAGTNYIAFASA